MPRTIVLEDGTEEEVPTQEELQALQEKASQADTLAKDIEALRVESEDKSNPDWRLARQKMKNMEAKLAQAGKKLDDEGNIIDTTSSLSSDQILEQAKTVATQAATSVALNQFKDELLRSFNEEDRKVVEHYFTKLSAGEELDFNKVRKFVDEASRLAQPADSTPQRVSPGSGAPPRISLDKNGNQAKQSYSETDEGRQTAEEIWGKDSFTKANQ